MMFVRMFHCCFYNFCGVEGLNGVVIEAGATMLDLMLLLLLMKRAFKIDDGCFSPGGRVIGVPDTGEAHLTLSHQQAAKAEQFM